MTIKKIKRRVILLRKKVGCINKKIIYTLKNQAIGKGIW